LSVINRTLNICTSYRIFNTAVPCITKTLAKKKRKAHIGKVLTC